MDRIDLNSLDIVLVCDPTKDFISSFHKRTEPLNSAEVKKQQMPENRLWYKNVQFSLLAVMLVLLHFRIYIALWTLARQPRSYIWLW